MTTLKMMWLFTAILVVVSSENLDCGGKFTLDASNPSVTFTTSNYPQPHNTNEQCTWEVFPPGNVAQFYVSCNISIIWSPLCILGSFSYESYDEKVNICGRNENVRKTLKGSTSIYKFKSSICTNLGFKGVSCTVYYRPDDIPIDTTQVDPNCTCGNKIINRIVGGNRTIANEYPWQAMLIPSNSRKPFCGGSLIAKQWTLTAAHCVKNRVADRIFVILGEHHWYMSFPLSEEFEVKQIILHEDFRKITLKNNDIALLKLKAQVDFKQTISPICLPFNYRNYDFSNKIGIITGWGKQNPDIEDSLSHFLKYAELKIIMPYKCLTLDGYGRTSNFINENMICTMGEKVVTGHADSGGPLVWKSNSSNSYFQIGILSFGSNTYDRMFPDVYTRVSQFIDWIKNKTGAGNEFCAKM